MSRAEAAQQILKVHAFYAERGVSLATAALGGSKDFVRWNHYPKNDLVDEKNKSRFFYHAHDQDEHLVAEHGHFHVFTRSDARPSNAYSHLVGISVNALGSPTRIFTTNQWVTGEIMKSFRTLETEIQNFRVEANGRLAPIALWLTAMIHFYKDAVVDLIKRRDEVLSNHKAGLRLAVVDKSLHIVSEMNLVSHWNNLKMEIE